MFRDWHIAAIAAAMLVVPVSSGAADANGARTFLGKIYANFVSDQAFVKFHPTTEDAPRVFDAELVSLIRENDRLTRAQGGEVGALDYDPLCGCQDTGFKTKIKSVRILDSNRADAVVAFSRAGSVSRIELTLALQQNRWRIHDIADNTMHTPSLRAMLIKANREAASGR